jgi:hypothetical protein
VRQLRSIMYLPAVEPTSIPSFLHHPLPTNVVLILLLHVETNVYLTRRGSYDIVSHDVDNSPHLSSILMYCTISAQRNFTFLTDYYTYDDH